MQLRISDSIMESETTAKEAVIMTLSFHELVEITNQDRPENKTGYVIYRGFTFQCPGEILQLIPNHFHLVEKWCYKTLRVVWISKKYLSILTYCEGDMILEVCKSMKYFKKEIKRTAEFYREH